MKVYRRADQRMLLAIGEAIADPYAMQPQSIMEEQESRRELYDGLKRLTQREQTYLLYRYGFTDGEECLLIGTAIYFHLTKRRAKKTMECERKMYVLLYRFMVHYENVANFEIPFFL